MLKRMDTSKIPTVPHPKEDCAWCWYTKHHEPFPENQSSSCCTEHKVWQLVQREAIRQQRAAERQVQR